MRGITIKLTAATLERLRRQARKTGRSVAALIRDRVGESQEASPDRSVHALAADLAGSLAGSRRSASNRRRRFQRS